MAGPPNRDPMAAAARAVWARQVELWRAAALRMAALPMAALRMAALRMASRVTALRMAARVPLALGRPGLASGAKQQPAPQAPRLRARAVRPARARIPHAPPPVVTAA